MAEVLAHASHHFVRAVTEACGIKYDNQLGGAYADPLYGPYCACCFSRDPSAVHDCRDLRVTLAAQASLAVSRS